MNPLIFELSPAAEKDLPDIIRYTNYKYGQNQVIKYTEQLEACMIELSKSSPNAKMLPDMHPQLSYIHCYHHCIFGLKKISTAFLVIAIFHQKMDFINRVISRL